VPSGPLQVWVATGSCDLRRPRVDLTVLSAPIILYAMRVRTVAVVCAASLLRVSLAVAGAGPLVQYLAGIELLRASPDLSDEQKAGYYVKLCEVTGVSAEEALKQIRDYDDRPEQWKKVQATVISLLEEPQRSEEE
jgi:hypothetical protein